MLHSRCEGEEGANPGEWGCVCGTGGGAPQNTTRLKVLGVKYMGCVQCEHNCLVRTPNHTKRVLVLQNQLLSCLYIPMRE